MKLAYSDHARRRMAQRKISEAEVEYVLQNFTLHRRSQDSPGCFVYTGLPMGRKVEVEVDETAKPPRVVTVWGDRRR